MATNQLKYHLSFSAFAEELNSVLKASGIVPVRHPVVAGSSQKKNLFSPSDKEEEKSRIGWIVLYMEEHYSEELTLDELAGKAGLSKYQLIRKFRQEEGVTPWRFIIGKRIEKVKGMLRDGMAPGPAAAEAGFYDQSHLTKVFREETGFTPKEYQEKYFRNRN